MQHIATEGTEDRPAVSVVSPVYGCAGCLEELADRVWQSLGDTPGGLELVLVDDASPDGAWARIQEIAASRPWVRGLRLSRNFGQHAAISAGISHARGDWVAVMDCDLQDVPEELPRLLGHARSESLDVVFGQRVERQDGLRKRISSRLFFGLLAWLTGVPQDASTANFGVFHRRVIDAVNAMPERDRTFPLMVRWAGFPTGKLPVQHSSRAEGQSGYTLRKLLALATSIALGYSEKPLRLVAGCGIVASFFAFFMVAFSVIKWLEGDIAVAGYTSIIASVWLLGGGILFCLGIVGLYVGQTFRNAQGRPSFIVAADTQAGKRRHD